MIELGMPEAHAFGQALQGVAHDQRDRGLGEAAGAHQLRRRLLVPGPRLAENDHGTGLGVGFEQLEQRREAGPDQQVAADRHVGALADAAAGQRIADLAAHAAAARDDADRTRPEQALRLGAAGAAELGLAGADHALRVRADHADALGLGALEDVRGVVVRHALRQHLDQRDAMLDRLERRIAGRRRRDEQHRNVDLVVAARAGDGVVHRHVLDRLAAAPGRHAGDHAGAVAQHVGQMRAGLAGADALHQHPARAIEQDAHGRRVRSTIRRTASSIEVAPS
jgi:hypothetical protein